MITDIEIAQKATLQPITQIANKLNIPADDLIPYGKYKAKLPLHYIDENKIKQCKLILVSAITPTPAGEGKTTTSVGLNEGLNKIGLKSTVVLREPSLGPVFGMKGGATGGGYAQVVPMEDINLHFTGDFAAVEKAHNLLSALIENQLQAKNPLVQLDPLSIVWKRVMDMNDRSLRHIMVAMGGKSNGSPRETGFDITVASEVMAILCLSKNLTDLKERLGNIYIGKSKDGNAVFAKDLKANGAMAALLKDAIKPNLVQTLEGNPAIIHGGPFANIAQGTNTLIATKTAMSLSDYVVTEAGFAFDLGGEKFLDIKCRMGGIAPQLVVLVATIRALKSHGGVAKEELTAENVDALKAGFANLEKHLENVASFGLKALVAINQFPTDTAAETEALLELCKAKNIQVSLSQVWAKGGEGAIDLATKAKQILDQTNATNLNHVYELDWPIKQKIEAIATKIYGAGSVAYQPKALTDMKRIEKLGYANLAVCMAKTQYSFSDDAKKINRPSGFTLTIREIELAAGAGFMIPMAGEIMRMPGLPNNPAAEQIDVDADGNISGLF
ncbi:MAG: formate--tetrahydrofolate ligase [Bacteroidia bacterium]|jgi:formate--tetrahydrofolate ligase|nr:formate--tetrahydrofolate ligase [Bacteroidia bacterium]